MAQVTAKLTTGTVVHIANGRHEWTADEPLAAGGTDNGPDPYELANVHADDCEARVVSRCPVHKTLAKGVHFRDNTSF